MLWIWVGSGDIAAVESGYGKGDKALGKGDKVPWEGGQSPLEADNLQSILTTVVYSVTKQNSILLT